VGSSKVNTIFQIFQRLFECYHIHHHHQYRTDRMMWSFRSDGCFILLIGILASLFSFVLLPVCVLGMLDECFILAALVWQVGPLL